MPRCAQEIASMSAPAPTHDFRPADRAWREALLEVEYARVAYLQQLQLPERDERELDRLWLRLWRAERRRDELYRVMDY
jgi:hypothetical protein